MPAITRTWYELMYFQCLFLLMHKTGGRPSGPFVSSPAVLVPSDFAPFFGFFFLRFFFELALGGGVGRSLTELSCLSSWQSVFVAVDDWDGELEYWGLKTARSPYSRGTLQWCSVDIILDVAPDEHGHRRRWGRSQVTAVQNLQFVCPVSVPLEPNKTKQTELFLALLLPQETTNKSTVGLHQNAF